MGLSIITIDSQIWIYRFDSNAPEHQNVKSWLIGEKNSGVLFTEDILMPIIIPIEVAHHLFKIPKIDKNEIEQTIALWLALENCDIKELDQLLLLDAIKRLQILSEQGIGGRDALILATMEKFGNETLVTHDKDMLKLKYLKRIDPVFNPPLILEINQEFDLDEWNNKLNFISD